MTHAQAGRQAGAIVKPLVAGPYKGGKASLAARLIPLFPPHRCYVEPFGGMASVLLAKPRAETEVYNDRDVRLVSLFAVMKYHPEEFDKELAGLLKSRQQFDWYRDQPGITEIQRAARFLYLLNLSYAARGHNFGYGTIGGGWRSLESVRMAVRRIRERLQSVTVECLDWEQCLEKYDAPHTFFYCDPPYQGTEGYAVPFSERDQRVLAERLRTVQGKWLVTNTESQAVRQLYRGFPMRVLKGRLCLEKSHTRQLRHLVITNYDPPRP